jgi:dolichol-phosphate mannosyltransferase
MRISVVIPAYNEAGNIGRLVEEIYAVLPASTLQEVIVIDDASDDGTGAEVKALLARYPSLCYFRQALHAGQSAALHVGVTAAAAPVIATMDGDGQNDPNDIVRMSAKLGANGGEPALVCGIRKGRQTTSSRKVASRLANWIRDKVLADGCPDSACGLKLYRRDAYLDLPFFTSMHRFLPAFFLTYGHEIAFEPINDRSRLHGVSKYTNVGRAMIGLYDLVGVSWLRRRTGMARLAERAGGNRHGCP